jgi:hypothetical protein
MSAAATAAGYLYASGRLRARGKDEGAEGAREDHRREDHRRPERREERHETHGAPRRRPVRIAAVREVEPQEAPRAAMQRPAVKVEYRTRRWRPGLDE